MEEEADATAGERRFAQLNIDAIQQITALLPTSSLLALTAVSQELGRTFCPAVVKLAVSKVSLRAASLAPALQGLSRRYPLLTDLDLSYSAADDENLHYVATHFPQLTRLSLEGCDAVSDAGLDAIAHNLPTLLTLQLLGCRDVSDLGLQALLARCTSLRALHLGWCCVTDAGLRLVSSTLGSSLTFIDLSGCARVSDRGVRALVAACRNLNSMQLEGCRELSGWAVAGASSYLVRSALRAI